MVVGSFQSAPLYLLNGVPLPKRGWRFFSTGNTTILRRYRHTTISGSGFFIFSARCFWPTALMLPLKWPFTKPLVLYCYLLFLAEHLYQILILSALRVSQAKALLWWMLICQKYLIGGQLVSHTELSLHICHNTTADCLHIHSKRMSAKR